MDWEIKNTELVDLGKIIGGGQFGIVKLTQWRGIKTVVKTFHTTDDYSEITILDEFKKMALLHHPNIIQTLGYVDVPFGIVMEYVDGMDLDTFIKKKHRADSTICISLMKQLVCALAYLHRRKPEMLIHRDIKPSNILIHMPSMHLKLGDFGISKFVKEKTNSNLNLEQLEQNDFVMTQNVGTLRYMAPEVYDDTNHHEYTHKVDIWSTSMVFYMLWEKYPPNIPGVYGNIKVNEYRKLLCNGNRPFFYITPPAIQKIIEDGWQLDEIKRPDALTWLDQINNLKKQWVYDIKIKLLIYV